MNKEQIAKLKELAEKAIEKAPWPFYLAALDREATPEVILELIALAERAILAAAPSPAVAVEPDAYQYRAKLGNGDWSEWRPATKLIVDTCSNHELYEVRGLYATPSPSLAVRDVVDAARYRFLKAQHESEEPSTFCVFFDTEDQSLVPVGSMPGEMDETIDLAMKGITP